MAKAKQKEREPTLRDFVHAAVLDQPLARRMAQQRPAFLSDVSSIEETALADVVIENYLEAARFLLDLGVDVNTRGPSAETPLMSAAGLGYREMVCLLMERGADVNARDGEQETAMFKAARHGYAEVCEALLEAGAEPDIQSDMVGKHPRHHPAAQAGAGAGCFCPARVSTSVRRKILAGGKPWALAQGSFVLGAPKFSPGDVCGWGRRRTFYFQKSGREDGRATCRRTA